ncbi:MAG: DUF6089 family protein [Bacteroidota bacterium]
MSKILRNTILSVMAVVFILLQSKVLYAQRIEVGLSLGAANYVGDLAPSMVPSETKPAIGIFGRYALSSSFAFKAEILSTQLTGSDQNFAFNAPRNLSFRTDITEYSGVLEFNFSKYGLNILDKKFTSYVFLGVAMLEFKPETYFQNAWYDLRSIKTEGKSYGSRTYAIPFGMGIKYKVGRKFGFEANVGFRKTYTDYLDDVSGTYINNADQNKNMGAVAAILTDRSAEINNGVPQFQTGSKRGNADFNDWYMVVSVSLSYRIFNPTKCARFY